MRGVDERSERRGDDSWGGEGGAGVGAVDEEEGEDGGDVGVHGWRMRSRVSFLSFAVKL